MLEFKDVLTYALGTDVPDSFARHLLNHQRDWDEVFRKRLEDLAYEFRPDLAVWELEVSQKGFLTEKRIPLMVV